MSKTEDKCDEKAFYMKGNHQEATTIPAEDGLTPTEKVDAKEEAIKQIATINKENKAKQIIQKRRINNQLSS
jgi:hypothetical protein